MDSESGIYWCSWRFLLPLASAAGMVYMKIALASSNKSKLIEYKALFPAHDFILPEDLGITKDIEETGSTFLENAMLKAKAMLKINTGLPVMSDDSGLCVPALDGAPGIFSKRYGSKTVERPIDSASRNRLLLQKTSSFEGKARKAFFACCLVLAFDEYRFFSIQETLWGTISRTESGTHGFDYDPIFYLPDRKCTLAEVSSREKNIISHRAKAARRMDSLLKETP